MADLANSKIVDHAVICNRLSILAFDCLFYVRPQGAKGGAGQVKDCTSSYCIQIVPRDSDTTI